MGQRVIPVAVTAEYIGGDGVTLGAAGSHNSVLIEYDFRSAGPQWDDISGRYVLWTNPQGNSTNRINLGVSEKVAGYEGVYQAAPPADAMCVPGWAEMVVVGFTLDGDKEVTKVKTEPSRFRVLPGSSRAADNEGVAPTVADQLQAEIEAIHEDLNDKKVNKPTAPRDPNGTRGQFLMSRGGGATEWVDMDPDVVEEALERHPEWTTTVQDGAITSPKIAAGAVTASKLQDGAVERSKLDSDVSAQLDRLLTSERRFKIVSHRGYVNANNIYARDDSQAAYSLSGVYGFDAIEVDTKKDVNGRIVILHNSTVDSLSTSSGAISDLDSREVFYCTSSGTHTNIPLCSLEDVICIARMYNMMIFFDMGNTHCTITELVEVCEDYDFYDIAFFGCPDDAALLTAPDYAIKILGGYTFNPNEEMLAQWAETYGTENFGVRTQTGTTIDDEVDLIKSYGFLIFCTAGDMREATRHHIENMDYVLTDNPIWAESGATELHGSFARMYSAVNLFKPTNNGETIAGVTMALQANGTYLFNGTFEYSGDTNQVRILGTVDLAPGTYILSGAFLKNNVPFEDYGNTACAVRLYIYSNADSDAIYYDRGKGITFTVTAATQGTHTVKLHMVTSALQGKTLTNLVLKPMVRHNSVTSDAYAPYAMTNKQLTEAIAALTQRIEVLEG